jgi:hypothetical protein
MLDNATPEGFVRFRVASTEVVSRADVAPVVGEILRQRTLYDYGAAHPVARRLSGRGVAYAVALPTGERVVIRHNRHGGALAPVQRDLFLPPTRAPRELQTSERLRRSAIPTPAILAYAVYRTGPLLRRADVVTEEIQQAFDLSVALMSDDATARRNALAATATLVRSLSEIGARHLDLNIKNVLLQPCSDGSLAGYVLDVDRVVFLNSEATALEGNTARLIRSARKWQARFGARITDLELADLVRACRGSG